MEESDLREISPKEPAGSFSSAHVMSGIPIPKQQRLKFISAEEWEEFTEEWASSLSTEYFQVKRFAGSGDRGLDVVGFCSSLLFGGEWDNFQCKYYKASLTPTDVWVELGKLVYFTFTNDYSVPRRYYFVAPQQTGTKLSFLLTKPDELRTQLVSAWDKYCKAEISSAFEVPLDEKLSQYIASFDFSIFDSISSVTLIEGHEKTPHHTTRFGGGLAPRPNPSVPPMDSVTMEQRYARQLLAAYCEHCGESPEDSELDFIRARDGYWKHFNRQRERFYHAESLRNYARDTVPAGTFEDLQEDVFNGVVEVSEGEYENGLDRANATIAHAAAVQVEASPLESVTRVADKQGICHQLVDEDRLSWSEENE